MLSTLLRKWLGASRGRRDRALALKGRRLWAGHPRSFNLRCNRLIVSAARAGPAEDHAVARDLTLVDDLFMAMLTGRALTILADNNRDRSRQLHPLPDKKQIIRHALIAEKLGSPTINGFRGKANHANPCVGMRCNPDSSVFQGIDERCCDLAKILDAQRSSANRAAGDHGDTVYMQPSVSTMTRRRLSGQGSSRSRIRPAKSAMRTPSTWRGQRWVCKAALASRSFSSVFISAITSQGVASRPCSRPVFVEAR